MGCRVYLLWVLVAGCSEAAAPIERTRPIEVDALAIAGARTLVLEDIPKLQAHEVVDLNWVNRWIEDALIAQAGTRGGLDRGRLEDVTRSALARALLERLYIHSKASGEPTETELREAAAKSWFEFDRPPAAKTTHVVVRTEGATTQAEASDLARRIALAVKGAETVAAFAEIARRFPHGSANVVMESLPPVTEDGRSLELDSEGHVLRAGPAFDETFAKAANAIAAAGQQSTVVHSSFGYHVIYLEAKISGHRASLAELKLRFAEEVYARRARATSDRLIQSARHSRAVAIDSAFQAMIAQSQVVK